MVNGWKKNGWEIHTEKLRAKTEVGIWVPCYVNHALPFLQMYVVHPRNGLI